MHSYYHKQSSVPMLYEYYLIICLRILFPTFDQKLQPTKTATMAAAVIMVAVGQDDIAVTGKHGPLSDSNEVHASGSVIYYLMH